MNIGLHLFPEIVNTYEEYFPTGVYGKKTVSAKGCEPRTEEYTYDATHRFITKVSNPDFTDFVTKFTYDPKTGNKLTETDINNLKTNYIYNSFGQLTKVIYPDGTATKDTVYWFSGANLPNARYCTKTTSSGKPELIVYYDILGREICRKMDGFYTETQYNNRGQVAKTSEPFKSFDNPNIVWSYFTYDDYGRQNTIKAPYSHLSYAYNERKVTVTDILRGVSSWKDYDTMGRIIEAQDTGGNITYNYTVNSKKRHVTTIVSNGDTTIIESDLWGNRLKIKEPNAGTIYSNYNKFNELTKQLDARYNITTYKYDKLGRITQKQYDTNFVIYDIEAPFAFLELDTTGACCRTLSTKASIKRIILYGYPYIYLNSFL